jgi:hypothetical protein
MELTDIAQEIRRVSKRLDDAPKAIFNSSREFAEAERDYRKALSMEIIKLRSDGLPAQLCNEVAKGNVSDFLYKRDLCEGLYRSSLESCKALQAELSGLQSIMRYQDNV